MQTVIFHLEANTGNVLQVSFVDFATKELPVGNKMSNLSITSTNFYILFFVPVLHFKNKLP